MLVFAISWQLGLAGILAIPRPSADPAADAAREGPSSSNASDGRRFEAQPSDPRASSHAPPARLGFDGFALQLRVSNQIVHMFGLERPYAYGLDVQLGGELVFRAERVGVSVRPQTGYAFVHHADFDSHASITGAGLCVVTGIDLCYTPSLVIGSEVGELSRGVRHGLSLELFTFHPLALEAQHGVVWVGSAEPRHELRGALTLDVLSLFRLLAPFVELARGL